MVSCLWSVVALVGLVVGMTLRAPAASVVLTPTKDNTIYGSGDANLSNGLGDSLFAGKNGKGRIVRSLVAFSLVGQIPVGATINSVTLTLGINTPHNNTQTVELRRLLADWGQGTSSAPSGEGGGAAATTGDATWNARFLNTAPWTTPGGDFSATVSASQIATGSSGNVVFSGVGLVTDVQAWLANPSVNFGWMLLAQNETAAAVRFASRESAPAPSLVVDYTAPVNVAPAISSQPSNQVVAAGGTATFSVVASGTPSPTYQWERQPAGTAGFSSLATSGVYGGTATPTLTVGNVALAMSGDQFRCRASNGAGEPAVSNAAALAVSGPAANAVPVVTLALPDQTLAASGAVVTLDLRSYFTIPGVTGQIAQFDTVRGKLNVELLDVDAPSSVANFLSYVNRGAYVNALIHRSVPGFVIQGGGFALSGSSINPIPADAPVVNEFKVPNTRGTLALAKLSSGPNTATNQWFFNLADNRSNLDSQNGGSTVFARVLGTGMTVADNIAALPVFDASSVLGNAAFNQLPLTTNVLNPDTLVLVRAIKIVPLFPPAPGTDAAAGFTATSSAPSVAIVSVVGSLISVARAGGGAAIVTVRAEDVNGNGVTATFGVTAPVTVAPLIGTQPGNQVVPAGGTATFSVVATGTPSPTYQWRKGGVPIVGATNQSLTLNSMQVSAAGSYDVVVTNSAGSVTSDAATLTVSQNTHHSGDTDRDFRFSLTELTRVIELYNTRNGTVRTGCYAVATTTTVDGFAPDANRLFGASFTLAHHHSADSNADGRLSLTELTRVIELYNVRSGTTRTGAYRVQAGTEDGFAPGP